MESGSLVIFSALILFCCCGGLLVTAAGVGVFFFMRRQKTTSSRAPSAPPAPPTDPAPPDAVRQALLALNRSSSPKPYIVRLDGDNVVCEWNIVDAKWLEAIEAKGLSKDYKLEITLDEAAHTARFLEIETKSEGSVGASGGYAYAFDADIVKNDTRQAIRSVGWAVQ